MRELKCYFLSCFAAHLLPYLEFQIRKAVDEPTAKGATERRSMGGAGTKRKSAAITSIPANSYMDDFSPQAKKPRGGMRKSRSNANVALTMDDEDDLDDVIVDRPPDNLQEIINEIFQKFWELDMDPTVATPFFGVITRHNCGTSFNMPDYFDKIAEACTLANIKV